MNQSTPVVRDRFAPSPTGYLHVGGLRTALYNFLFARKHGGTFVLRIEDTDRARFVPGAVENLTEALRWSGIEYDEGPGKDGVLGPYIQSERLSLYASHAQRLLASGNAYRCFCTPERLDLMRKDREAQRLPPRYDRRCLNLSPDEVDAKLKDGVAFAVRMKIPDGTSVRFHDVIRGEVEFSVEQIDDQVILKSDGYPTYHLANVVDDHLMKITHVIRGEEWLSSTPKHVLLYGFFGWEPPVFAHLPLLLNPDRSKLSKRQGDVAVEEYRSKGYLPEALVNFVALLGWNPGDEREIFSLDELIAEFSLDRVGKSGAIFNIEKLNWLNAEHLRRKPMAELIHLLREEIANSSYSSLMLDDEYLIKVIEALRERVTKVRDFIETGVYFFEPPSHYDPELAKKRWKSSTPRQLQTLIDEFSRMADDSKQEFEAALKRTATSAGISNAELIHAVRLAISGVGTGPGLYDILNILGREESIRRIHNAIDYMRQPA
jgi:glutamyl-tRNA synthetase